MKYRTGSAAAAIQRQTKYIEAELKARKSQAAVRREMMAAKTIGEVSQAYFDQVLRDLGLNKTRAASPSMPDAGKFATRVERRQRHAGGQSRR